MDVLHVEQQLYYQRCLFPVLELDVKNDWSVMASNTHYSVFPLSYLCVLTHIPYLLDQTS